MPGLVPGIHVWPRGSFDDVDGRDKPGHDVCRGGSTLIFPPRCTRCRWSGCGIL